MSELTDPEKTGAHPTAPDQSASATTAAPPAFPPTGPVPDPEPRGNSGPALVALALLLLLAGLIWVWRQDAALSMRLQAMRQAPTVDPAQVAGLQATIADLRAQVAALVARPRPVPVSLAPLNQRLSMLEQRRPPDLGPLDARVAALEKRPLAPDLGPLDARVAALEKRPLAPALGPLTGRVAALEQRKLAPDLGPLDAKMATLETQVAALAGRVTVLENKKPRDPALEAKVSSLDTAQQATQQQAAAATAAAQASAARAGRLAALEQAQAALADGKPLGAIPDAPPPLARFATVAPPTEAALRLSFPQAARAAVAASVPATAHLTFVQRMWQRAQALVTVRHGDRVLVGAPAAITLAAAQARLEAGDLAGAVAALDKLDGPAAKAMAPWRAQAQALLDARAALASASQAAG